MNIKLKIIYFSLVIVCMTSLTVYANEDNISQIMNTSESNENIDSNVLSKIEKKLNEITAINLPNQFNKPSEIDKIYALLAALDAIVISHNTEDEDLDYVVSTQSVDQKVKELFGPDLKIPHGQIKNFSWLYKWDEKIKAYTFFATGGYQTTESIVLACNKVGNTYVVKMITYDYQKEYADMNPTRIYKGKNGKTIWEHDLFSEIGVKIGTKTGGDLLDEENSSSTKINLTDQVDKKIIRELTFSIEPDDSFYLSKVKLTYGDPQKPFKMPEDIIDDTGNKELIKLRDTGFIGQGAVSYQFEGTSFYQIIFYKKLGDVMPQYTLKFIEFPTSQKPQYKVQLFKGAYNFENDKPVATYRVNALDGYFKTY